MPIMSKIVHTVHIKLFYFHAKCEDKHVYLYRNQSYWAKSSSTLNTTSKWYRNLSNLILKFNSLLYQRRLKQSLLMQLYTMVSYFRRNMGLSIKSFISWGQVIRFKTASNVFTFEKRICRYIFNRFIYHLIY